MTTRDDILKRLKEEKVNNIRLWFTDVMGRNKNVEVPMSQIDKALDGQILFDGSSIEGFSRIEESDMLLVPDYETFVIFPEEIRGNGKNGGGKNERVARLICDVKNPDGSPFAGCPRGVLRSQTEKAAKLGYKMFVGPEAEFFLFERDALGRATTNTHDRGGYFDLTPIDKGEEARRAIVEVLEAVGFEVEAAHHEVADGQHEIDFKYAEALETADNIATFRFVVRKVALDYGLHATFMPKPIFGINGSGMHCHQSLFTMDGKKNVFYDPKAVYQISDIGKWYIGGLLRHARGFCAITNPLVNSYKRLVPGYEAPTLIAWSERNRSPLVRIPDRRGDGTRAELRCPDPSCNPYLAIAVMLASGLDGIQNRIDPGPPTNRNVYEMNEEEMKKLGITSLPGSLLEAVETLEADQLMRETIGNHIAERYIAAKREEWHEYIAQVHQWELDRYLASY
ncbi:MAG: glutamine synthetase [Myxococcales bacterium]|nr:MAG: glutamine synthetase [Myxococcales bacterium]